MKRFRRFLLFVYYVLKGFIKMANSINDTVDALTAQVAATEAGEASVIAYVQGVPALIQAAVDSSQNLGELQAKLTALQGRLADSATKVAAAVAAAPQASVPVPNPNPGPAIAVAPVTVTGTGTVVDPGNGQA